MANPSEVPDLALPETCEAYVALRHRSIPLLAAEAADLTVSYERRTMSKNILVVGFGPGNGAAVAEKFGKEGFSVGLLGRNEERLAAGVSALKSAGISAAAFPADATDPASLRAAIRSANAGLGPITVIHWNAYGGTDAGDLLTADAAAVQGIFDVAVFGLLAAAGEALPDLKSAGDGAILVTNGGFGDLSPEADEFSTAHNVMGIALANAAKEKLVGLLAQRLKGDGVYVGEVTIYGTVKGPSTGGKGVDPTVVADRFWDLYRSRGDVRARIS
jgi:NAD(P)-dependent dehydrogenase (short-subunit alcohol dehydrogenase family)